MLKIAIVFPIFNGLDYTKKCLQTLSELTALADKSKVKYEVVITDDGSSDGSAEWIRENYPEVYIENGDGNLWWSGGINKAIRFALGELNADYTLWWNNDVIPEEVYFTNLAEILLGNPDIPLLGSKVYLDESKTIVWSMGGIFNMKTGYKEMIGFEQKDSGELLQPQEADWLTGMGTVVHKSVYKKIGFVDADHFPQYHGDSDFTLRAKKAGFKIKAYPQLRIYNDTTNSGLKHGESAKKLYNSLVSIRSNFNVKKDFLFYQMHSTSIIAYKVLINKYVKYIGGFYKWKLLGLFGKKRH